MTGPWPVPVPVPVPQKRDEVDFDHFDQLSRSLPTAGPVLEPEPSDLAMLRPVLSNQSSNSSRAGPGAAADASVPGDPDEPPCETSPLLRPRTASTAGRSGDDAPLFLNDTSPGRFWFVFSLVLAAHFIGCFDGTIMASSHPVITSYFGAANSASWLSTAFLLTSTAFQPLLGRLSDAIGRKPLFLGCLAILALATAWCALAPTIQHFIVARAFCGLGAGGSMTLGSIITSDLVPIECVAPCPFFLLPWTDRLLTRRAGARRRGAYQSYLNVTFGLGSALGAALGGAMAEALGWRWEFGVQVPPLVLCFGMAAVAIPAELGVAGEGMGVWQALHEFDARGSLLLTSSICFLILGLVSPPLQGLPGTRYADSYSELEPGWQCPSV